MTEKELAPGVEALVRRVLGDVEGVERTAEGVSTNVCRIDRGEETFYLRLAQEGHDMAPEVEAHDRLRALGVRVADVIHYEPLADETGCSIALTTAIAGTPLIGCDDERISREVARAAGRDLALLNSVEVDGWGWLLRDGRPGLRGNNPSWEARIAGLIAEDARAHLEAALGAQALAAVDRLIADEARRTPGGQRLAHGDFDVSQIFFADGVYTGIIDLSDIQAAESHDDLAHFLVHDTEQNEYPLLPDVVAGYSEIDDVPDDNALIRTGVLQKVAALSWTLAQWGEPAIGHPYVRWMRDRIVELVGRIG